MNKKIKNESEWLPLSDIMTGLMIIFLFISISYMLEVQKKQKQRDIIFEEFRATKEELYAELENEFKDDFKKWDIELDKDLSIKFTNPDVLFSSGKTEITDKFKNILNEFLPRYFNIILKDKYKDKITEVRIEGHTDNVPAPQYDPDPYIGNVILSQLRATEALKYFRNMEYYSSLSPDQVSRLQFWLTANGLAYGRTLDDNKVLTIISGKPINNNNSRRVEFRIVTTSENLVKKIIEEMKR